MTSLENFLNKGKGNSKPNAAGSFECQECHEVVFSAFHDEDERTLKWYCSANHESVVRL